MNETYDVRSARKSFSRIGAALTVILVVASVLQVIWFMVPALGNNSWGMWLGTFLPLYVVAVPVGLLLLRRIPREAPTGKKLGAKNFAVFLIIGIFFLYAGNLIGTFLSQILSGGTSENAIMSYAMDGNPVKVLVMVILAPLIEEFVFRKQIIDRTERYGEKTAVLLSGLAFGLFHMNLYQFFYAFALGLLFAYIYIRTGRLRYPVLLHAIINFVGSVLAPAVLSLVDLEALENVNMSAVGEGLIEQYGVILPGLLVYMAYSLVLVGLAIAGLVLFIMKCRKLVWKEAALQLPKGTAGKTVYCNAGMIVYILLCLGMMAAALLL